MEFQKKLEELKRFLSNFEGAVVAFSGGVDSATLAAICKEVIDDVLAVTVRSAKSPTREIENARRVSGEIRVDHKFLDVDIFSVKGFTENSELRCYYCKKFLIKLISEFAITRNYRVVFDGTNASDLLEDRPGYRAIVECDMAFSPWADFGMTKDEIRAVAKSMGFSFYNAPSLACLATRIPYGVRITVKALKMIDDAENSVIRIANVLNARVRNLYGFAVVEVEKGDIEKVLEKGNEIRDALLKIGFKKVFINPQGYKSGVFVKNVENMLEL